MSVKDSLAGNEAVIVIGVAALAVLIVLPELRKLLEAGKQGASNVFTGMSWEEAVKVWQGQGAQVVNAGTPQSQVSQNTIDILYYYYGRPLPAVAWQDIESAKIRFLTDAPTADQIINVKEEREGKPTFQTTTSNFPYDPTDYSTGSETWGLGI